MSLLDEIGIEPEKLGMQITPLAAPPPKMGYQPQQASVQPQEQPAYTPSGANILDLIGISYEQMIQQPKAPPAEQWGGGLVGRNLQTGFRNVASLGKSLYALGQDAVGNEEAATQSLLDVQQYNQQTASLNPDMIGSIGNIKSFGDFGQFVVETVAQQLPIMIPSIAGAVVGGIAGTAAAPGAGTVAGAAAGFSIKKVATGLVQKAIAKKVAQGLTATVARKAVQRQVGQAIGSFIVASGLNTGETYQETFERTGKTPVAQALTIGALKGVLDTIPDMGYVSKITGRPAKQIRNGLIEQLSKYGKKFVIGQMGKEGLTEAGQYLLDEIGVMMQDPNQSKPWKQVLMEAVDNFVAGGLASGVLSIAAETMAPTTPEIAIQDYPLEVQAAIAANQGNPEAIQQIVENYRVMEEAKANRVQSAEDENIPQNVLNALDLMTKEEQAPGTIPAEELATAQEIVLQFEQANATVSPLESVQPLTTEGGAVDGQVQAEGWTQGEVAPPLNQPLAPEQPTETSQQTPPPPSAPTEVSPTVEPVSDLSPGPLLSPDLQAKQTVLDTTFANTHQPGQLQASETPRDNPRADLAESFLVSRGKTISWFTDTTDPTGKNTMGAVSPDGTTIFLNVNAKDPVQAVAMHEFKHTLDVDSPSLASALDTVIAENTTPDLMKRLRQIPAYANLTDEQVQKEASAFILQELATKEDFWQQVNAKDPGILQQFIEFIKDAIEQIKATVGLGKTTLQADQYIQNLEKIQAAAVAAVRGQEIAPVVKESLTTEPAVTPKPSKKPRVTTSIQNVALDQWKSDIRQNGIRRSQDLTKDNMGGIGINEALYKDTGSTWDILLQRAYEAGLITENEQTDPGALARLLRQKAVIEGTSQTAENEHYQSLQVQDLTEQAQRGRTISKAELKGLPKADKDAISSIGQNEQAPYLFPVSENKPIEIYKDENKAWHLKNKDGEWIAVGPGEVSDQFDAWIKEQNKTILQKAKEGAEELPFASVQDASDAEYLKAVEKGDMAAAQKMVDEAAKKAGYNVGPVWHGTKRDFTVFDPNRIGSETDEGLAGQGFYFHPDETVADAYGKRKIKAYLKATKTFDFNNFDQSIREIKDERGGRTGFTKWLSDNGYDSVRLWKQEMVLDPSQIKSAEPVTYDAQGNVIPLSQRFNPKSDDIRFASVQDTYQNATAEKTQSDTFYHELIRKTAEKAVFQSVKDTDRIASAKKAIVDKGFNYYLNNLFDDKDIPDADRGSIAVVMMHVINTALNMPSSERFIDEVADQTKEFTQRFFTFSHNTGVMLRELQYYNARNLSSYTYLQHLARKAELFGYESSLEYRNAKVDEQLKIARQLQEDKIKAMSEELSEERLRSKETMDALKYEKGNARNLAALVQHFKERSVDAYHEKAKAIVNAGMKNKKYDVVRDQMKTSGLSIIKALKMKPVLSSVSEQAGKLSDDVRAQLMVLAHDMIGSNDSLGAFDVATTGTLQNGWMKFVQNNFGKDAIDVAELKEMWTAAQLAVDMEYSDTAAMDARAEALATGKPIKNAKRTLITDLQLGDPKKAMQAISRELKNMDLRIAEIIKADFSIQEEVKETLSKKLMEAGLAPKDAALLAIKAKETFSSLLAEKTAAKIAQAKSRKEKNALRRVLNAMQRKSYTSTIGKRIFAQEYGLGTITPELETQLKSIRERISKAEEGSHEYGLAVRELEKTMAKNFRRGMSEIAWTLAFSNLLGSPTTGAFNLAATTARAADSLFLDSGILIGKAVKNIVTGDLTRAGENLIAASGMWTVLKRSRKYAHATAINILKTGYAPDQQFDYKHLSPAEYNALFEGPAWNPLRMTKYVQRSLQAEDALLSISLAEVGTYLALVRAEQAKGVLHGKEMMKKVAEEMGYMSLETNDRIVKANESADKMGLTGAARAVSILQDLRAQRDPVSQAVGIKTGFEETFNKRNPYGIPGRFHQGIVTQKNSHIVRYVGMFSRIAANVSNYIIETTPLQFLRLGMDLKWGHYEAGVQGDPALKGKVQWTTEERTKMAVRAATATAIASLWLLKALADYKKWEEDDDPNKKPPAIDINGYGPQNPSKRKVWQLNNTPYSIRFHGGRPIKLTLLGAFASPGLIVAGVLDEIKHGNYDTPDRPGKDLTTRIAISVAENFIMFIKDELPAKALGDINKAILSGDERATQRFIRNQAAGMGNMVIPGIVRWMDRQADPTVYTDQYMPLFTAFFRNTPLIRQEYYQPLRTVFGDRIERTTWSKFVGDLKNDEEAQFLSDLRQGVNAPTIKETTVVFQLPNGQWAKRPMTGTEYDHFLELFGQNLRKQIKQTRTQYASPKIRQYLRENENKADKIISDAREAALNLTIGKLHKELGIVTTKKLKGTPYATE